MRHLLEKTILISFILLLLLLGLRSFTLNFDQQKVVYGVSFDPLYAAYLGFNAEEVMDNILNDLKVDHLRLTAYWNRIEKEPGAYDWAEMDWQMNKTRAAGAKVILTVGRKLPRWPECYEPAWLSQATTANQQAALFKMITATVARYKNYPNLTAWQVENEPLVGWFGVCPAPDKNSLKQEIALVKSLDDRPVILTDSGELGAWYNTAKFADIFGTTIYRVVANETYGFWRWPLPAAYYHYKAAIISWLTGGRQIIVTELQAEPWIASSAAIQDYPLLEQYKSMSLGQFKSNILYARAAGFDEIYLWGVEWWYWLKETKNTPEFWDEARLLWIK
ncbi:MAG: hypothetical protein WCT37_04160 [Patescibacteria group bacterium]|jgi:hypothetical protein